MFDREANSSEPVQVPPGRPAEPEAGCCGYESGCEPCGPSRRQFIKLVGVGAASASALNQTTCLAAAPVPAARKATGHFVPAEKHLDPKWVNNLLARGTRSFYSGDELRTIAMPIGGICAGQLYLAGDGRLMHWDLFNQRIFSGYGRSNYQAGRQPSSPLQQGFAIQVRAGGKSVQRTLDRQGLPGVRFCGEYPIGTVVYEDEALPVAVTLEAFSPFIPLNAADSALPATVMQFTLRNRNDQPVEVALAGWLENGVCLHSSQQSFGARSNRVVEGGGLMMVVGSARPTAPPAVQREPIVLADFEGDDYGKWQAEGEAFGDGPAAGTLPRQQRVSGFQGHGLVNSFRGGDRPQGKLTSPPFRIDRNFINFLIGGGRHAGRTCMNLLVDGRVVRTATGRNRERLRWQHWDVRGLAGKEARIEIVDAASGPWGHINVDQIELADRVRAGLEGKLEEQADFGTMGLAVLAGGGDGEVVAATVLPPGRPADVLFDTLASAADSAARRPALRPFGQPLIGAVGRRLMLAGGQQATVTFVLTWCFPNRPERGNFYATRFGDAAAVARYLAANFQRLSDQTRLWHQTWYDSTLPHWLLDRLFSTVSTLATSTCQWWANGRFWAYEGVGCCHGTCTHVWNYEHAMARLFPRLERSAREMQDFNPEAGFVEATGMVRFRGENWNRWAGDGQAGTILKAYREHLVSADEQFLKRNWPRIRKATEFLIREDRNDDGLLEGAQHNTYDIDFHGANTMVGSLYLAALRAAEEMAKEVGDAEFANRCHAIFEKGSRLSVQKLFNGEYFIQDVDLAKYPKFQYATGCLSDQLFGQGWAHQVGLGYIYPQQVVRKTLESIWRYNWAPDIGPQNKAHRPERWFVSPGEAGLFTCTWPKGNYLDQGVRYKNEVWTGIEYQVAGHMAWEGMVTEALAICRAVHDRYHPSKRNPWNEVECGDHYARAMASYGVFLGLCGYEYHGPRGHLGFAPRLGPADFRAAFTAAAGWGTISQKRSGGVQTNRIDVKWGRLRLQTLAFELPDGARAGRVTVTAAGQAVPANSEQDGTRLVIRLAKTITLKQGESLQTEITT